MLHQGSPADMDGRLGHIPQGHAAPPPAAGMDGRFRLIPQGYAAGQIPGFLLHNT